MFSSGEDRKRQIVDSLRPGEANRSHSNSHAEMVIATEDVGIHTIGLMNDSDKMAANHTALIDAGWNGTRCIGQISVADAIKLLHAGKPLSCRCTIRKERRRELPHAYRCTKCQGNKEEKEKKRERR